jgi:CRISPR-associated protein Csh2
MMTQETLTSRREFLFCYDIRMGNPNGDPDENRPRILPDGTYYVTDVRLKRFIRDHLKAQGHNILVDNIEGRTTNLTGRVGSHLKDVGKPEANGRELVDIILRSFVDARMFGSTLAFKRGEEKEAAVKPRNWEPEPKTLTGATQIEQGEVLHQAQEVDIRGTSIFGSTEERRQGTFTENFVLRYGLVGFGGVANEYSAKKSLLTDGDYAELLGAAWRGVRSAGNTRTKAGQVPRLLVNVVYKPGSEFQLSRMLDYVRLGAADGQKPPESWTGPLDYVADLALLRDRLEGYAHHIERIEYDRSPDLQLTEEDKAFFKPHLHRVGENDSFEVIHLDFDGPERDGR